MLADFVFSQNSLQDYVICARRFQLRFVLMQPWPALITESPAKAELHVQRSADLHHLIHERLLGVDLPHLEAMVRDPQVARWWRTYLQHPPADVPQAIRRPEVALSAPLGGHRLVARLDLLAVEPGHRAVIIDWKTPLKQPSRAVLARRLQTRVYRLLVVEAGSNLDPGQPFKPEQVEMVYWFASSGNTERFSYSADQYAADRDYLAGLIQEIAARPKSIWPLTPDERQCRFCNYRSLCERDVKPAFLEEVDDDVEPPPTEIDLEQVAEIAF